MEQSSEKLLRVTLNLWTHRRISHLLPLADACPLWWSGPSSPPALCHRAFLGRHSRWATTAITVDFESDGKCMASPRGRTARTYRKRARTPLRAYAIAGTLPALDSFLSADRGGEATFVPRSGERDTSSQQAVMSHFSRCQGLQSTCCMSPWRHASSRIVRHL